ncbi:DNA primase [Clostridium tarantellae]|uniref:DNA primase n=1 Tax=Clostridium tarantellae TaxID=39493 RepID=A0A6I1MPL1_9CLOT|nr:DNA primase [Clostridium tarantellae]MPQ42229.1 DNA primase [Clostridium tarantellae]
MQIPEDIIEKVKEQNDIVDVISEVVRLKRAGRNFSGLCPFHNEKTPSFSVSQDKQIFKCFGCGEAGNVISFVMKNKNKNFIEAVEELADRANISLYYNKKQLSANQRKKEIIYNINKQTARYFFANLHANYKAKEYFLRRGITESILKSFGLGYAKDGWQNTINYLRSQGVNDNLILEAGLAIKNEKGKFYDRFRNRVIFPVFDYKGNVIGFGGRVLDDSKPKYLNSPETLVFQKGTNLYGLNFALKSGLKDRTIIIVEGYMDCISLHQYDIKNTVASLGTALTDNQARLLKRYVDKVIISYDADIAGQNATMRGLEILKNAGLEVNILKVPQGKDPDEFIRVNGRDAFLKLINKADRLIDYKLKRAKEGINFSKEQDLIKYSNEVVEILSTLNPVEKDIYIKKIAEQTSIKEQALYDLLNNKMTYLNRNIESMNNKEEYGTKLYVEPAYLKSERSIIKLYCVKDGYSIIKKYLNIEDFILENHKNLLKIIEDTIEQLGFDDLLNHIEIRCKDPEILKEWLEISELEILQHSSDIEILVKDYIYHIKKYKLENEKSNILKQIKEYERKNMIKESLELVKKTKGIADKLKELERSK